jgi:carbon-monoxide dehydrogenase large subunit
VARANGRYEIYSGVTTMGQGHETVFAQIAADELGAEPSAFRVFHGSTAFVDEGWGTYHSRAVVAGGSAVKMAAQALREKLQGLKEEAREGIEAKARFDVKARTYPYGTHVAHVAVDPKTAQVEVLAYVALEDVGKVINPLLAEGQAVGGTVQGIGACFLDELIYDADGQLLTATFADYLVPTSTDVPRVTAITLEEVPSQLNPLGAKGAGEGATGAVGAAIANAVADALSPLDVKITALPLSLDKLAAMIRRSRR